MSELPAFRQLQEYIREQTTPRKPRQSKGPKAETANELTRRIVKHIRQNGGFATRLSSTGTYRADIGKFVGSQQVSGMPDVFGLIDGRALFCEIKVGRDVLSPQQQKTIGSLESAGGQVFIAHDFESFRSWFDSQFLTPSPQ